MMVAAALPGSQNLDFQSKFHSRWSYYRHWGQGESGGIRSIILLPETFMNRSGLAISAACSFFKIDPKKSSDLILVVHDDLELPFGTISLRRGGGLGGHNGLRSIKQELGSADFLRFRIGIGRPAHGNISSFVLSRFSPEEEAELPKVLSESSKQIEKLLLSGFHSLEVFKKRTLSQ